MSNGRYWTGIIVGILAGIVSLFLFKATAAGDIGMLLMLAYLIMSSVATLIWFQGFGVVAFLVVAGFGWGAIKLSGNMISAGTDSPVLAILGLILFFAFGAFFVGCIGVGFSILGIYSLITFPFRIFTLRKYIY